MIALRGADLREAMATLRAHLASGLDDVEAMGEMGLDIDSYEALKSKMFDAEKTRLRDRSSEDVYVDYALRQQTNISDLTEMIKSFKETKQYNALVGAVKARAEILDKLIAKGQEFGLIDKRPERKEIIAGVFMGELSDKQLRQFITGELTGVQKLMNKYGSGEVPSIIDVKPGNVHYSVGPVKQKALPRNLKVTKGRKVVKRKAQ